MTDSWWLKVERAEHHFKDLDVGMRGYEAKHPYRPVRKPNQNGDESHWEYILEITEQPDPTLSLILGDVVHNLRTSLDHVLVAMRPWRFRWNPGFPLLDVDIWEKDSSGEFITSDDKRRASFDRAVQGLDDPTIALVKQLQPYWGANDELDVKRHPLGILGRFDNADKHRQLVLLSGGVANLVATTTVRGGRLTQAPPAPEGGGYVADGAVIVNFGWFNAPPLQESEVNVEISGTPEIAVDIGVAEGIMPVRSIERIIRTLREEILPALESHVPTNRR
jgi:hypothetical protein